jgi:hypothetical protein
MSTTWPEDKCISNKQIDATNILAKKYSVLGNQEQREPDKTQDTRTLTHGDWR